MSQVLRCTYSGDDSGGRTFDILIDGKLLTTQTLDRNQPGKLFNIDYPIPSERIANKTNVTVRFQARPGNMAGGLFYCAVMKASE